MFTTKDVFCNFILVYSEDARDESFEEEG